MKIAFLISFLILPISAFGDETCTATKDEIRWVTLSGACPENIVKFMERFNSCEHFAGEGGDGDAEREKAISSQMAKLKCDDINKDRSQLKQKYKKSPVVTKVLEKTEDAVDGKI